MANEVEIKLTADEKQALEAFNKVSKAAQKFESQQKQNASKENKRVKKKISNFQKLSKAINQLGTSSQVAVGVIAGNLVTGAFRTLTNVVGGFIGTVKEQTILLETLATQFEVVTGSAEKAKIVLKDIQDFAATTPFQFPELAKSARQLIAFGFEASTITKKLRVLGDISAGSGAQISDLSLIFGQVSAAGKLTGERLLQLEERGIILGPALAKSFGVSESAVRSLVSSGKVGFKEFEEAFSSLTDEGGKFFDATSKRSQTLGGLISTLNDNMNQLAADIGGELLPQFKELVGVTTEFIQNNKEGFTRAAKASAGFFSGLVQAADGAAQFLTNTFATDVTKSLKDVQVEVIDLEQKILILQSKIDKDQELGIGTSTAQTVLAKLTADLKALTILENSKQAEDNARAEESKKRAEDVANAEVGAQVKKFQFLDELELSRKEIEAEKSAGDLEARQLASDEEFAFLEANLGRTKALQVKNEAEQLAAAGKQGEALKKIKAAQIEADKKGLASLFDFEKNTNAGRAANFKSTLGTISTLSQQSNSTLFAIGKAASIAQATIDGIGAVQRALNAAPPPFNFALAGLVGVASAANLAKLASAKPPSFQEGGIVPGTSFSGDNVGANVNSGELILNRAQQGVIAGDLGSAKQTQQAILAALEGISAQPTIVQIDGREIARTIRDEGDSGFAFAV